MKKFIFFIVFLGICNWAYSQTIRGFVKDSTSLEPLYGAIVRIPELNIGTLTDTNGYFELHNIPVGEINLQISFIGYDSKIISLKTSKLEDYNLNILLNKTPITTHNILIISELSSTQHTTVLKVESIDLNSLTTTQSFDKILKNISGVDIISKGNGIIMPVIRGLSRYNILVLKNGFRLNDFQFSENHPFFIDEIGNRRIEIIKGASSILFGSDAIGGVINVLPDFPAPSNKTIIKSAFSYNTNGEYYNSNIGLKHTWKKVFFGIYSGIKTSKDYKDAIGQQVYNTRFNSYFLKSFVGINYKFGTSTLYYDYIRSKYGLCIAPAIKLIQDNLRENRVYYQDLNHHFLAAKNEFLFNNWKINLDASFERNQRGLRVDKSQPLAINMFLNSFNYQLKIQKQIIKWRFISAIQGNITNNKNDTTAKIKFLPDYKTSSIAGVFYAKYFLTSEIKIQGGIRYDLKNYYIPPQNQTIFSNLNKTYQNFSSSLGMLFHSRHFTISGNLSSAFRTPSVAELAEYGIHAFRFELGNPDLKTQRSYEADLSLHLHLNSFMFDIATYYNYIKNFITLTPTNNYAENGMKIYTYIQENSTIYGLESSMETSIRDKWNIKSSFTYALGEMTSQYLPLFPQNKINAEIFYKIELNKNYLQSIQIGSEFLYAFAQNRPSKYETPTPSYYLINPFINALFENQYFKGSFNIYVNNVLNIKYVEHTSTLKNLGFYQMGRNFMFSIKLYIKPF